MDSETIIIVPEGEIIKHDTVRIEENNDIDGKLSYACYNVDSYWRWVKGNCIKHNLELAAVYAASSCAIPDAFLGTTGSEAAIEIIRRCWVVRPFTIEEENMVHNIMKFALHEPALYYLCSKLLELNAHFTFLYENTHESALLDQGMINVAAAEYRRKIELGKLNFRRKLTKEELYLFMGSLRPRPIEANVSLREETGPLELPIKMDYLEKMEELLKEFVEVERNTKTRKKFPLLSVEHCDLERDIIKELRESWEAYQALPLSSVEKSKSLYRLIKHYQRETGNTRLQVETYLFSTLSNDECRFRLSLHANRVTSPKRLDILRIIMDPMHARHFKLLTPRQRNHLHDVSLLYGKLCVLVAKMKRISDACSSDDLQIIKQELFTTREWSVEEYPNWLVFEVEGGIQVRPAQYLVAQHLLKTPGAICQLNMGLGKTRVILPLVILHLVSSAYHPEKPFIRVNFMPSLVREATDYMQQNLTASILRILILEMPFNRNVEISEENVSKMKDLCNILKKWKGCLVLTPEHRLSFYLKCNELKLFKHPKASEINNVWTSLKFKDIIDESDDHKNQLVYAIGTICNLENGPLRWNVAHTLLEILNSSPDIKVFIEKYQEFVTYNKTISRPHFVQIRLAENTSSKEAQFRLQLKEMIFKELLSQPYYNFELLYELISAKPELEAVIKVNVLENGNKFMQECPADIRNILSPIFSMLLALRGYLAFGILEFGLEQRHRVQYGIDTLNIKRMKRMAVPFRAADIPSESSEFSHPDVGIVLTSLAYYYQKLTAQQLKEAKIVLLGLGPSAQEFRYNRWYHSVSNSIPDEERSMLDSVFKIDLTNSMQELAMFKCYHGSLEVINFWLANCVFPLDTTQYPKKIVATPWHVANSTGPIGFSGTNDNHRLLPLQVRQLEPASNEILSTNGYMLHCILNFTLQVETLFCMETPEVWKSLLERALNLQVDALIDTGSLLAGVQNSQVAEYLVRDPKFAPRFQGVFFFSNKSQQWMVLDKTSKRFFPRHTCSIKEHEAFVLFDDARSRGSDMKMHRNAVALLTLGPRITKDKLMQGAGRLRKLGTNQKIIMIATPEVESIIRNEQGLDSSQQIAEMNVLSWALSNTKTVNVGGLARWADQGFHYTVDNASLDGLLIEENLTLNDLYSIEIEYTRMSTSVDLSAHHWFKELPERPKMAHDICHVVGRYGHDIQHRISNCDETCEREFEQEEEEEAEREIEVPVQHPSEESPWDYSKALQIQSFEEFSKVVELVKFSDKIEQAYKSQPINEICWNLQGTIHGTRNFFNTIQAENITAEHLRIAEIFLVVEKRIILLSDQEADGVLEQLWNTILAKQTPKVSYLDIAKTLNFDAVKTNFHNICHAIDLVKLHVFNGYTSYRQSAELWDKLLQILKNELGKKSVHYIIETRGLLLHWPCSDLKSACDRIIQI